MKRILSILFITLAGVAVLSAAPTKVILSGKVVSYPDGNPLAGVVVLVGEDYLWAVTDAEGRFTVGGIQKGNYTVKASYLGFVDAVLSLSLQEDAENLEIRMKENSLALDEVVVTAKRSDGISTSHTLGRDALNHLQMSNMTDMAALLPGGKTKNPDLTSPGSFSLRAGGSSAGNASFGTAVEVDGIRIGNNAGFGEMSGVDTRSIAVDNVESVEVITGVPSAEYGDLNSGMVRIHTKKGRTPLNVTFSVNPRTYQTSVSKGIGLGDNNGVLNVSGEWARATKKLSSPYESYTRRGFSLAYSNTFAETLRFEAGFTGNIGGMNSEDDPDAYSGAYSKVRDNVFRGNTSLNWQLNRNWITSLRAEASVNYNDNCLHQHGYFSYASNQPSVHSEQEGYFLADRLPLTYFSDKIIDSRELDAVASLKYSLNKSWNGIKSNIKAGLQWKSSGNVGAGEYYQDPSLAENGYRPRPYSQYPFMHNFSVYAEEALTVPVGRTKIEFTAGIRMENVYIKGSEYKGTNTFSPRLNMRWKLTDHFSLRGGWGIAEKLPSYYILFPKQEYRDVRTFAFSHGNDDSSSYLYYTRPFKMEYNPELRWQRNSNSEFGMDIDAGGFKIGLVGFCNVTMLPYEINSLYAPFSYDILSVPSGYSIPVNPMIKADSQSGAVYIRGGEEDFWTPMDVKVTDRTFARTTRQENGADVYRAGAELTVDFPEIKPIRTSFRMDASYAWSYTRNDDEAYYYNYGWSHSTLPDRSYQYVGIYNNGTSGTSLSNGKITHNLDANITSITHIPEARLIITCRLEMSLLTRSLNIPAGGADILYPLAYLDTEGVRHEWTSDQASDSDFEHLVLKAANDYLFIQDGYGPYVSANISITKEIGKHVSLSFFANNFTNSRPTVYSMATGVGAILTPSFYYGLTCRLKF